MKLAERDFKQPDLLTDEEVADILPVAESLNNWVQDLRAYATQQAVVGKQWPGYKLVAGRSVRKHTSEADVIQAATEAGYVDIYKTTLMRQYIPTSENCASGSCLVRSDSYSISSRMLCSAFFRSGKSLLMVAHTTFKRMPS